MGFLEGCHSWSFQKQLAVLNVDVLGGGLAPKMFLRECLDWRSGSTTFSLALKQENL